MYASVVVTAPVVPGHMFESGLGQSGLHDIDVERGFLVNRILMPMINEAAFALMEGVVWPFASETRELVLASELEKMDVRSWNGRAAISPMGSLGPDL